VRIRGSAFTLAGVELRGREYTDGSGEGAVNNPKPKAEIGVEFESRRGVFWTGLHRIGPITVSECKTAFVMRGGYTDKGQFTAYEGNCDNGLIDGPIFSNCDCGVRLENIQALCWKLRDAKVFGWGGRSLNHFVLVDCVRGGDVVIDGLSLNHVDAAIFLVHDFNPNGPSFVCRDLKWDHVPYDKPGRLTMFEYAGRTDDPNNSWQKFRVRVDGGMNNAEKKTDGTLTFDPTVLVRIPKAARQFPLDDILVDIGMMPTAGFERVGNWWKPDAGVAVLSGEERDFKVDAIARLKLTMEYDVVRSLMSGNDTMCFSTRQYVEQRGRLD
jgi:hypothetical protein